MIQRIDIGHLGRVICTIAETEREELSGRAETLEVRPLSTPNTHLKLKVEKNVDYFLVPCEKKILPLDLEKEKKLLVGGHIDNMFHVYSNKVICQWSNYAMLSTKMSSCFSGQDRFFAIRTHSIHGAFCS